MTAEASRPVEGEREMLPQVRSLMSESLNVVGQIEPHPATGRWRLLVEGSAKDLQAAVEKVPADIAVEPALSRRTAVVSASRMRLALTPGGAELPATGVGARVTVTARTSGQSLVNAEVSLSLVDLRGGSQTMIAEQTDADGKASFHYDPRLWWPALLMLEPQNGCWGRWQPIPGRDLELDLPELPKTGPIGWWHAVSNIRDRRKDRGNGIRIGVVDSGVGPHPYLAHVRSLGSVVGAVFDDGPQAGADVLWHGTHVSGIIAARPVDGSGEYAGLAEGAEVVMIRVFPPVGDANQGDIAEAIERLVAEQVDLINLSLGGPQPSDIERDAVRTAALSGTLCIAAAGNGFGQPILYPAAYPEVAAVSAMGAVGGYPAGTMEAQSLPTSPDRYSYNHLFVGNFSNEGAEMSCAAPGVGIISTVPARPETVAPYAVQSGTSMAAPVATAALATVLAADPIYRGLPRNQARTQRASALFGATIWPLGLNPLYIGGGLAQGIG